MSAESIPDIFSPLQGYNRVIFMPNPYSRGNNGRQQLDIGIVQSIRRYADMDLLYHQTFPSLEETTAFLQETAAKDDLIIATGGDGIVKDVSSSMAALKLTNPVSFWPRGGANDFTAQLYSRRDFSCPWAPLTDGTVRPIRPLTMTITDSANNVTELDIWGNAGHGVPTYKTALGINDQEFRANILHAVPKIGTLALETKVAVGSLIAPHRRMKVEDLNTGTTTKLFERLIANSDRMAHFFKLGADIEISGGRVIDASNFFGGLRMIERLTRGHEMGSEFSEQPLRYKILGERVLLQIDGEPYTFVGDTTFEVKPGAQPVSMITSTVLPTRANRPK